MDPGWQIEPCDMGIKALPAMHGFAPEHEDSYAALLSSEPVDIPLNYVDDFHHLMVKKMEGLMIDDCRLLIVDCFLHTAVMLFLLYVWDTLNMVDFPKRYFSTSASNFFFWYLTVALDAMICLLERAISM